MLRRRGFFWRTLKQDDRRRLELLVDTLLVCAKSSHMLLSLARQALSAGLWSLHFCMKTACGRAHTHKIFDHLHFTHCLLISSWSILNIVRPSPSCRGPLLCLYLLLKVRSDLQKENRTSPAARGTETRLHADRCILWRPDRLLRNVERRNTKGCIHS